MSSRPAGLPLEQLRVGRSRQYMNPENFDACEDRSIEDVRISAFWSAGQRCGLHA
jgi:hypothetical protein